MWTVDGYACSPEQLDLAVEPAEVLYDFDGPRLFTTMRREKLVLAYQCDEDHHAARYLFVPTTRETLSDLKLGRKTVREALDQPIGWVCDVPHGQTRPSQGWEVAPLAQVRSDRLPAPGVMLSPELQPLLSIRLIGPEISKEHLLASVVKRGVEAVTGALKALTDFVLTSAEGRPRESRRRLYNLHAQRLAFSSLEIGFSLPDGGKQQELLPVEAETLREIEGLFREALDWLSTTDQTVESPAPPGHGERALALLKALDELSPPQYGEVEEIELGGRLGSSRGRRTRLTRAHSKTIRNVLKATSPRNPPLEVVDLHGRVRELDKDELTFMLREIQEPAPGPEQRFSFEPTHLDELLDLFVSEELVRLVGVRRAKNVVELLEIERG